jgi:hypothetical protein
MTRFRAAIRLFNEYHPKNTRESRHKITKAVARRRVRLTYPDFV